MASHYKVELGQAIKRRREELGLTQKDLADATHYKEAQTVSRWERGENLPSNLEVVAGALQWTLAEMVAGIEPPDRRTARRLGHTSPDGPALSQLDRIELGVKAILAIIRGDADPSDAEEAARLLGETADRVTAADASPGKKVPGRSGSRAGGARRKNAS